MTSGLWGVVVADIVSSSRRHDLRSVLGPKLRRLSHADLRNKAVRLPYAVTAGDEFQTVAGNLERIPELVFELRRRMRPLQLRIGVGIGTIQGPLRPPVNQLGGQAFEFARQAIQKAKESRGHLATWTQFCSGNEQFDSLANLIYSLHDALVGSPSQRQWETVDAYLAKKRVDRAARALKVNASTASRNLKRSHLWYSLETISTVNKLIASAFSKMHNNVSN